MQFYVGIGSNINPLENITRVLTRLNREFGPLMVSRVAYTEPEGMLSNMTFINTAVLFQSNHSPFSLKNYFNQIETEMGRDRTAPNKNINDRVIDLDILLAVNPSEDLSPQQQNLPTESYIRPFIDDLLQLPNTKKTALKTLSITIDGQVIGLQPTQLLTPHLDTSTT